MRPAGITKGGKNPAADHLGIGGDGVALSVISADAVAAVIFTSIPAVLLPAPATTAPRTVIFALQTVILGLTSKGGVGIFHLTDRFSPLRPGRVARRIQHPVNGRSHDPASGNKRERHASVCQ